MNETFGGAIDECCSVLKLDFSSAELARLTLEKGFSQETLDAMTVLFNYLRNKKEQTTIQTILRMSRLPQKVPKTFDDFDFGALRGNGLTDLEKLQSIRTLAPHLCTPQSCVHRSARNGKDASGAGLRL
jgi:hypothetical protein